jgi:hypothetical protein
VGQDGRPAPGFSVTNDPGPVDCRFGFVSEVAVDGDVSFCTPSAEFAVACWTDPSPGHVVCFRDPWQHELVRMPTTGAIAPPVHRFAPVAPLGLELSDGEHCLIRDGGAWGSLASNPAWVGYYYCGDSNGVFAPNGGTGIDQSSGNWTVQVSSMTGSGPLITVGVRTAYFVGTRAAKRAP